jgi:hypothetical protein
MSCPEYFRLPRPVSGSVRLSARIASRLCWRFDISDLDGVEHLADRLGDRFDDGLDLVERRRAGKFLARAVQRYVVARRHPERLVQNGRDIVDLAYDLRADLVDTIGGLDLRQVALIDLFEIGVGQPAAARQRLVDDLVERSRRRTRFRSCAGLHSAGVN